MTNATHDHSSKMTDRRALAVALVITTTFLVIEVIGGVITNSLALLSDAGHMLSDASALGLSLLAVWLASRPHTHARTFGYHRVEILAALANGVMLMAIAVYVVWEAVQRFSDPPEVQTTTMLLIAMAGLGANLVSAGILNRSDSASLNVRSASVHVAGDALGSLGAIVAALIMLITGWYAADPLISLGISALILVSAVRVTKEALGIVLEFAPGGVSIDDLRCTLLALDGVTDVHDLHLWTITSGFVALSAHARLEAGTDVGRFVRQATIVLGEQFKIAHATIQPEIEPVHGHIRAGVCCLGEHAV
jgi:cobalt-zinc-cadmium efflux system protein